ncbi:MAG: hypothetical protein IKN55_08795 [Oscillospiraceae bacterium]|nr:hypothetical protein [Oscillospiraceae bacterium]
MKHTLPCLLSAGALLLAALPVPAVAADTPALLDASGFKIYDENLVYIGADYLNPATVLFDDQDKVPVSPDNTNVDKTLWDATTRNKNWKPNWQAEYGDDAMFIDLGANFVVTGLCFLDTNDVQTWNVEYGEPYGWKALTSFETDSYNSWRGITFEKPAETRYLRFTTRCGDAGVSELAIYGYQKSELTDAQKKTTAPSPADLPRTNLTAGQRIGFNAFIDDPMTAIMAGGNVREYHNFSWLYDDSGKVKFTQGTWGDMDSFYQAMADRNISVIPCFQGGSPYVSGEKPPEIPVPSGADTTDPASYALHAQAFYQVAARYGSNKDVDPATLNVSEGSEPKTGLGLLGALENSNEPNKTWSGKANYFSPAEMAAMCSADYDGLEGTIPNAGVRNADPNFKLAIGGLLTPDALTQYLDEMRLWFAYHRKDGKFAVDILNVHMGPDTYNPEDSGFVEHVKQLQAWIDKNAPGTELWISEFEIPMADCEAENTDSHDNAKYQLRYAQRVARTYLLAVGADVDRMTKFQLRDEGEGVYYNSGLTTGKGEWSKKLAWYYTACLTNTLKDADFTQDASKDGVMDYVFTDRRTGDTIHCLWSPTNEDKVVKGYTLSAGTAGFAYQTTPGTYAEGVTKALSVKSGKVQVDVSETPVFVRFSGTEQTIVNGRGQYIRPQAIRAEKDTAQAQSERMFDEPDSMPAFIYGDTKDLKTPETDVTASGFSTEITLDKPYILTGFGVYDTFGTGSLEIYDANTGKLLWSSDLGSYMSRSISLTEDSAPTDKLRIVKGGGALNEVALFGYAAPETSAVQYDVTNDGRFDTADIIAMTKWLHKGTKLANAAAGDAMTDGVLDVYDLALMKRSLLEV